jgi:putative ABC transport system substrate-binding protein
VTGVSDNITETTGKWVELLKETVPSVSRLAAVVDTSNSLAQANLRAAQRVAQTLGLHLMPYDLRAVDDLWAVLLAARGAGAEGVVMVNGGALGGNTHPRIGGEVLGSHLPAISAFREFVQAGGLLAYGANIEQIHRRPAAYVDKILKGAKPGDLPVEKPTRFDFVINLKSAQAFGLTVPPSVLQQATEVIQ